MNKYAFWLALIAVLCIAGVLESIFGREQGGVESQPLVLYTNGVPVNRETHIWTITRGDDWLSVTIEEKP